MTESDLEIDDARNVVVDGYTFQYHGEIPDYKVIRYKEALKLLNEINNLRNQLQTERTDRIKERADTINSMIKLK